MKVLDFYDTVLEKWLETPAETAIIRSEQVEAKLVELKEEIERLKLQTTSSHANSQE